MDFKNIPVKYQPAYTWLWNTTATKEETKRQIDKMYDSGIRAFYVLGEPENFRPGRRNTHLSPEYLSDEYIEQVYYAYEAAKEKGMHTWLYNEGGFPSGMVCGKIREAHPELALKEIVKSITSVKAGEEFHFPQKILSAFANGERVYEGAVFEEDTEVECYTYGDSNNDLKKIRSDIANKRNTEIFLGMTHERLKRRFGDAMGTDVTMMFDDEAYMGTWTDNFEGLFYERFGYDICDYMPWLLSKAPENFAQSRAKSDYIMLCGDLVRNNYFDPMRKWLNNHNMLSVGHLNNDNVADFPARCLYGNALQTLRTFDVPGIDVIWGQINYPDGNGKCCENIEFFPVFASSAARQQGHSIALSESFAVYGSQVTPDLMRFGVNFQAVMGISLFNFMVISYDRTDARCLQYRPNYIPENPGMDMLSQINNYTARLSCILQNSKADIHTALYYPQRTICGGGEIGKAAEKSLREMGEMLLKSGVSFDVIDEEFVLTSTAQNGVLEGEHVTYENVFLPEGRLEYKIVTDKIKKLREAKIEPVVICEDKGIMARRLMFEDGAEGYFVFNSYADSVNCKVGFNSEKAPYMLDLFDGTVYKTEFFRKDDAVYLDMSFVKGEGAMVIFSENIPDAKGRICVNEVCEIKDFDAEVIRKYEVHDIKGPCNTYYTDTEKLSGIGEWEKDFSGEVKYTTTIPDNCDGRIVLDLGEVRHYARILADGKKVAEITMPPYSAVLENVAGQKLEIIVANTCANACAVSKYFENSDPGDVGPYHARMIEEEKKALPGGLIGPVKIYK